MLIKVLLLLFFAGATQADYQGSIEHGEYQYAYFAGGQDYVGWCTALVACQTMPSLSRGSTLAVVKTEGISIAINTLLSYFDSPQTWLGGNDKYAEGEFVWVDGTPLVEGYTNWNTGEPNNNGGREHCLLVNWETTGKWNDDRCEKKRGYVCQIPSTGEVPPDYSELAVYESNSTARTFPEAKGECDNIGARLVEVADRRSKDAILKKLESSGHNKYWVSMPNLGSRCSTLSQDGPEERDCDEKQFGFICETARPNTLNVSDEQPEVNENGDVEIHCSASGYPLPVVAWFKDEELMSDQSIGVASSTLFIKNAAQSDAGKYICLATNTINGRKSKAMRISDVSVLDSCRGHEDGDLYIPDDGCYEFYYECAHGTEIKMDCPDGLVFDTSLSVCNWPSAVDACNEVMDSCRGHEDGDQYIPDDGCYEFFYQCVDGTEIKLGCPGGLVFDTSLIACTNPSEVDACNEVPEITNTGDQRAPDLTNTGYQRQVSCRGHEDGDGYGDDGCHEYYYECVDGTEIKKDCPSGLAFDTSLGACDWRSFVDACN